MNLPRSLRAYFLPLIIISHLATSSAEIIVFHPREIELILQTLNDIRGRVSPSAANMQPLIWNAELQRAASSYTSKCVINHNPDRADDLSFKTVGQTIASADRATYQQLVWAWKRHSYNVTSNICRGDLGLCNFYIQVVTAESLYVGCGGAICTDIIFSRPAVFLACYYAPQVTAGMRPYLEGPPCSACREDQDHCVNNLCVTAADDKSNTFPTTHAYSVGDDNDTDSHEGMETAELNPCISYSLQPNQNASHACHMSSMSATVLTLIGLSILNK